MQKLELKLNSNYANNEQSKITISPLQPAQNTTPIDRTIGKLKNSLLALRKFIGLLKL